MKICYAILSRLPTAKLIKQVLWFRSCPNDFSPTLMYMPTIRTIEDECTAVKRSKQNEKPPCSEKAMA